MVLHWARLAARPSFGPLKGRGNTDQPMEKMACGRLRAIRFSGRISVMRVPLPNRSGRLFFEISEMIDHVYDDASHPFIGGNVEYLSALSL